MKRILEEQEGFTLVEVLVSVGILSVIMGTIGLGIFQAIGTQAVIIDDGHAIYDYQTQSQDVLCLCHESGNSKQKYTSHSDD